MPRGNPDFGRIVKSPGRPPKVQKALDTKARVDAFIDEHIDEYLMVLHEDAVVNRNPKSAQALIERRLGKPAEGGFGVEGALAALLHALASYREEAVDAPEVRLLGTGEPDREESDGGPEA